MVKNGESQKEAAQENCQAQAEKAAQTDAAQEEITAVTVSQGLTQLFPD